LELLIFGFTKRSDCCVRFTQFTYWEASMIRQMMRMGPI
jgi:hypothetical protein